MKELHKEQIWEQVLKSTERVDPKNIVGFLGESHEQIFDEERVPDSVILKVSGNIKPKKLGVVNETQFKGIQICKTQKETIHRATEFITDSDEDIISEKADILVITKNNCSLFRDYPYYQGYSHSYHFKRRLLIINVKNDDIYIDGINFGNIGRLFSCEQFLKVFWENPTFEEYQRYKNVVCQRCK